MADFETIQKIQTIIESIIAKMGVSASVSMEDSVKNGLMFNVSSEDSTLLIGKQGANLQALQMLVRAMIAREFKDKGAVIFTIDVDDYRKKRLWFLTELAKQAVEKVKFTGRPCSLDPMNAYERRLVHAYIQEHASEVVTGSEGVEPYRKIVISLKKLQ